GAGGSCRVVSGEFDAGDPQRLIGVWHEFAQKLAHIIDPFGEHAPKAECVHEDEEDVRWWSSMPPGCDRLERLALITQQPCDSQCPAGSGCVLEKSSAIHSCPPSEIRPCFFPALYYDPARSKLECLIF